MREVSLCAKARLAEPLALLTVQLPAPMLGPVKALLEACAAGHGGYVSLALTKPRRGRSTGRRSQGNAINGGFAQLWRASGAAESMTFEAFRLWMKWRCPYWPAEIAPDGTRLPKSETILTSDDATQVIDWLIMFAAESGYELEGFND